MLRVDLNCDLGEGSGADDDLLPWVTSANIACGFHAGGPEEMRRAVQAAVRFGVAIGAHPGLRDREHFGRRAMQITPDQAYDMVVAQVVALDAVVRADGGGAALTHVKPHGALYNMAAVDCELADAVARAVSAVHPALTLTGLSGSALVQAGKRAGLNTASEVFADRNYQPDGTLTPRTDANALVSDVDVAVHRSVDFVVRGRVRAVDGTDLPVQADTICLHGDGSHAVEFARAIRQGLAAAGITVTAPIRTA